MTNETLRKLLQLKLFDNHITPQSVVPSEHRAFQEISDIVNIYFPGTLFQLFNRHLDFRHILISDQAQVLLLFLIFRNFTNHTLNIFPSMCNSELLMSSLKEM